MSAIRPCKTCGGDVVERLVAGHLVLKHTVEPKVWHPAKIR